MKAEHDGRHNRSDSGARPRRIRLVSVDANRSPPAHTPIVEFDVAEDGSLTPTFLPGASPVDREDVEALRTERQLRSVFTSSSSFVYLEEI